MSNPMVVVSCDRFTHNILTWSGGPASYLEALAGVGLLPVQLPTIAAPLDPAPLLDAASGVLITGARSNVHPSHYGEPESEAAAPFDHDRDRTTLPLIREAVARGLPLFCICRGIQELNVAFGGSLYHSVHALPDRDDHRSTPQEDIDA
ncbi:MAG: gamma-glutamyl-gamma-aminobutyrate hydrolase family protein, partial [Pseudomonadota bacterium]